VSPRASFISVFDVESIEVGECQRDDALGSWRTIIMLRGEGGAGICITVINDTPTLRLDVPGRGPQTLGEEWPYAYEMTVDEDHADRLRVCFKPGGETTQDWPSDAAVSAWLSEDRGRRIVACSLTMESTVRDDRCEYDFWDATCDNCGDEGTVEERLAVDHTIDVPCTECEAGGKEAARRVADDEARAEAAARRERKEGWCS